MENYLSKKMEQLYIKKLFIKTVRLGLILYGLYEKKMFKVNFYIFKNYCSLIIYNVKKSKTETTFFSNL